MSVVVEKELPKGWTRCKIEDVGEIITGNTPSKKDSSNYGDFIPWVKPPSLDNSNLILDTPEKLSRIGLSRARIVKKNSILVSCIGILGKIGIAGVDLTTNQQINSITFNEGIFFKYGYYFLKSTFFQNWLNQNNSATVVPIINKGRFSKAPFIIPPLNEQKRIVAKIEELFSLVDSAKDTLEKTKILLKQYRQSILKHAFEGKLTEEWRQNNLEKTGLDTFQNALNNREKLFRENSKDNHNKKYSIPKRPNLTNLPDLPKQWMWASFEEMSEQVTVGHVGSMINEYVEDGIPFLRSQNVRENFFDSKGLKFISENFHQKLKKSKLSPMDIVVVRSGNVGVSCVIPDTLTDSNCSDLLIVKNLLGINPFFGSFYLNSIKNSRVKQQQVGIALTHFNTRSLAQFTIPIPSMEEQILIVQSIQESFSLIEKNEILIDQLLLQYKQIKNSILKQAFEGKLVPQDPNDEPAEVLLQRIKEEKKK